VGYLGLVVLRVVSSTPTAGAKIIGKLLTPHYLCPPSSNGDLVEREKNVVNGTKPLPLYAAWLQSPQGDGAVYQYTCEFYNQGR